MIVFLVECLFQREQKKEAGARTARTALLHRSLNREMKLIVYRRLLATAVMVQRLADR